MDGLWYGATQGQNYILENNLVTFIFLIVYFDADLWSFFMCRLTVIHHVVANYRVVLVCCAPTPTCRIAEFGI